MKRTHISIQTYQHRQTGEKCAIQAFTRESGFGRLPGIDGEKRWQWIGESQGPAYLRAEEVHAIAAALPGEWSASPTNDEFTGSNWKITRASDGLQLHVSIPEQVRNGNGHWGISFDRDRYTDGQYVTVYSGTGNEKISDPSAKISAQKPVSTIAKEIDRRVIEPAEKIRPEVLARIEGQNKARSNQESVAREVSEAFGLQFDKRFQRYLSGVEFEVSHSGSAHFKINNVRPEKAAAIARGLYHLLTENGIKIERY